MQYVAKLDDKTVEISTNSTKHARYHWIQSKNRLFENNLSTIYEFVEKSTTIEAFRIRIEQIRTFYTEFRKIL